MKRFLSISCACLLAATALGQHPHMHIFRNDSSFTTSKTERISETRFHSRAWGDDVDLLELLTADGRTDSIPSAAIDSIVFGVNVPEIRILLLDLPEAEDLIKDAAHTKTTVYHATVEMDGNGHFDDLPPTEVEFRGRGNTTWLMPKTPYRFKFAKKQELCGLPKAKTYALIANYIDASQMRNVVAFEIARSLGLPFTNHAVPVNLWLNGRYRGAYFLTEKIGIGGASVDIDEKKGMLLELDTSYDEDFRFRYEFMEGTKEIRIPVMAKDPDLNELAEAEPDFDMDGYWETWKADVGRMMDAVTQRGEGESLADVIDVRSAADYVLVYLITGNHELKHPKSCFIWKESLEADARYHFGPVWDFDWAFTYDGREGSGKYNSVLLPMNGGSGGWAFFRRLVKNEEVRALIDARFEEFRSEIWPELKTWLDEYADYIEPSAKTNGLRWPDDPGYGTKSTFGFRENHAALIDFIERRMEWISTHANRGLY